MFLTYCNRCIPIGLHDGNDQNFQTFSPIDNFHRQQLQWQRLFSTFYPFHLFSSPHNCFLRNCFRHNYFHLKYMKEITFFFSNTRFWKGLEQNIVKIPFWKDIIYKVLREQLILTIILISIIILLWVPRIRVFITTTKPASRSRWRWWWTSSGTTATSFSFMNIYKKGQGQKQTDEPGCSHLGPDYFFFFFFFLLQEFFYM